MFVILTDTLPTRIMIIEKNYFVFCQMHKNNFNFKSPKKHFIPSTNLRVPTTNVFLLKQNHYLHLFILVLVTIKLVQFNNTNA